MIVAQTNPILIVGAGPTGIVVAIELARRGVPCRIIERKPEPATSSRAFTFHARTLEIFELMGVIDAFLATSSESRGFRFNFDGMTDAPVIDFTSLRSRYPYVAIGTQRDTERVLREHLTNSLGVAVEWNTELAAFAQDEDGHITATIRDRATRTEEHLTPPYVVGADGIHSLVRKSMGLPFEGEAYENMIMQMMDTEVEVAADASPEWVDYYMKEKSFLLTAALPDGTWRVLISDQGETAKHPGSRTEAFQAVVDAFGVDVRITEPAWTSQWVIWKRLADVYAKGNVFLAGDSAHVHSPTAGQGMNSCIQDGWNLGWKLALVGSGKANPSLLDSYARERHPIGQQLIAGTDALHSIMMAHGTGLPERMALTQAPNWQLDTAELIGGLAYTYRDHVDAEPSDPPIGDGPQAGDRAPDCVLADGARLYERMRHGDHTLLIVAPSAETAKARAVADTVRARFGDAVRTEFVEGTAAEPYGYDAGDRFYLIRPDAYVGASGRLHEADGLTGHLGALLAPCR